MKYVDTSDDLLDIKRFCAWIADIHFKSVSPTGKFGFHAEAFLASSPLPVQWDSNWATFFTKLLSSFFDCEIQLNGPWPEYQRAFKMLINYTILVLLHPLQSNGRVLKPCLVHGNLSRGNIATNLTTGDPVIFSPKALYAHNEYELGMWRRHAGQLDHSFFMHYFKHFSPSEPVEQWEDRTRLYSIRFNLGQMISVPGSLSVRNQ
jgi:protein-ribulosamine 3-kinase